MKDYRNHHELIIAPSVLAADWSRLPEEVSRAINAGADWLHVDVMDGHFVDNISFGPQFVETLVATNDFFYDVHLMISRPDHYLPRFVKAGADSITVHVEADHDVADTLKRIREAGCRAGLCLKPKTDLSAVEPYFDLIDLLLIMTIEPGFGGQKFMDDMMPKCRDAKKIRDHRGLKFHLQVDGGIAAETAKIAVQNGVNSLVAGTALYAAPDMKAAVSHLRALQPLLPV